MIIFKLIFSARGESSREFIDNMDEEGREVGGSTGTAIFTRHSQGLGLGLGVGLGLGLGAFACTSKTYALTQACWLLSATPAHPPTVPG